MMMMTAAAAAAAATMGCHVCLGIIHKHTSKNLHVVHIMIYRSIGAPAHWRALIQHAAAVAVAPDAA